MRTGTIFVVIVVAIFWLSNIDNNFAKNKELNKKTNQTEWQDLKDSLDESVKGIQESWEKIDEEKKVLENAKVLENTKDVIINPEPNIVDDTTSVECPEWINCMPMIDAEPTSCQVPVGCEGITQIAY